MRQIVFLVLLLQANTYAQTNVRGWYGDGQVWIVWETTTPLPETYAIYTSESPFTEISQATLIGRMFEGEWTAGAFQQQLEDSTQTYRVPDGAGGIYRLAQNEGLFVETVDETAVKYYAVVKWGETAVTSGVNLTSTPVAFNYDLNVPVQCHLQAHTILPSGHPAAYYYVWADGRDDHWNGRPDYPVMANHHKNGMPSLFIVSEALNLPPAAKRSVVHWLQGGGGEARDSLPTSRPGVFLDPEDGYLVSHNDDFYRYFDGHIARAQSAWFGWAENHDPFDPNYLHPSPGDTVVNYTQRRIVWISDWLVRELNADPERIAIQGHSRGSAGTTGIAKVYPDRFATASIFNNAFGSMTDIDGNGSSINHLFGSFASQLNLPTSLRNQNGNVVHMNDLFTLSTRIASMRDMPLIRTWHGKNDSNPVMHWDSTFVAEIRRSDAEGWGAQIYWDERDHKLQSFHLNPHWSHGTTPVKQTERDNVRYQERYLVNQSFPAFYNHQSYPGNRNPGNGDPLDGDLWGTWGGWHDWDVNSILDESEKWEVTAYLIGQSQWLVDNSPFESLTSDVAIRKPQHFLPAPDTQLSWLVLRVANGDTLQSGTTTTGTDGLVKVQGITVYRKPDSVRIVFATDVSTGVADSDPATPTAFVHQNYPNPFNPETTIEYEIPTGTGVSITIYNLLGQHVATLVNESKPAGSYKTMWDGRNESGQFLSAGVYVYRIKAGNLVSNRKLILLK